MRHLVFIFSLIFVGVSTAGELPWIGVSLDQASSEFRKETGLIHGVGFEISKVITGGPLASAGGKEGDLWWKFDGQILVNKSQMVVLLRTKSPGDEVEVEFYRGGLLDKLRFVAILVVVIFHSNKKMKNGVSRLWRMEPRSYRSCSLKSI